MKILNFLVKCLNLLILINYSKTDKSILKTFYAEYLNMKTVVAFIGAGQLYPLGYPSWGKLAKDMFELLEITLKKDNENNKSLAEKLLDANLLDDNLEVTDSLPFLNVFQDKIDQDQDTEKVKYNKKRIGYEVVKNYVKLLQTLIKQSYSESKIKLTISSKQYNENKAEFDRFQKYLDQKKSKELDFQTIFSECERLLCSNEVWQEDKQSNFFRILLKSYFQIKSLYATLSKEEQLEQIEWNPYLALLDLSIKKFATFNYDVEIERALLFKNEESPLTSINTEKLVNK